MTCHMKILNLCCLLSFSLEGSYSIEGKYTKNVKNYHIVYPIKISQGIKNHLSERSIKSQYIPFHQDTFAPLVQYKLNLGGKDEIIDLLPNSHIITSDAIIEFRKNITSDNDPLFNIKLRKIPLYHCFFKGKVRHNDDTSVALSICDGLSGYIRVKRHIYFIEPINNQTNFGIKKDQPHIVFENINNKSIFNCATNESSYNNFINKSLDESKSKFRGMLNNNGVNISKNTLYVETLLVMDKSMLNLHTHEDEFYYALTTFNMAQSLLYDLSPDPPINLEIVRIIEVEDDNDDLNLKNVNQLGSTQLQKFSHWQLRINPKENHAYHHDLAILLTGNDICDERGNCHYVGIAESEGACKPSKEAAICKDSGLVLGHIIAHEIAHTLGVYHDSEINGCNSMMSDTLPSLMSPNITYHAREWSQCSQHYLRTALENRRLTCLEDEPYVKVQIADILPGVFYNADYQCQKLFNSEARSCNKNGCGSLACEFEGTSCSYTGVLPALGTSCGEKKWCYEGECLEAGIKPGAVHGGWSNWSEWSRCSRTCGAGVSQSTRECDDPLPKHGGKSCVGSRKRHKICTTQPCELGSQPFRDIQCAEFDDWIFPEDGTMHKWKGFFLDNGNPCALYCINDRNMIASLSPKVKDGTTCYRGIKDICIDGICRNVPCDLQFDSNSVEDGCGVCHGNGTGCKVIHGQKEVKAGMSKIIMIPRGTKNTIIEEVTPTPSHFILKNPDTEEIINEGKKLGLFNISETSAWLGMIKSKQKILEIPGSLGNAVDVWLSSTGDQTVSYSMGIPSDHREGKYHWDYTGWSPCKVQCGDGVKESVPKCIEILSGLVEDKYCEMSGKPPIKASHCNAGVCVPRWLIGEWQECGPCPNKEAKQFRLVHCIIPLAGSEEGTVIVEDKMCPGDRPKASEYCRCVKRQVANQLYQNYKSLSDELNSLVPNVFKMGSRTLKPPEKKITLMQLENENEESMLEQLKENQNKHHTFFRPHFSGSKVNFSIPFKKREAVINQQNFDKLRQKPNKNHFNYINYKKHFPTDLVGFKKINNNITLSEGFEDLLTHRYFLDSDIELEECPSPHFSEENIVKLLSDNLHLKKLKLQDLKKKSGKPYIIKIPDALIAYDSYASCKYIKNNGMLELLMNEFYKILAANAFMKSKINRSVKRNSCRTELQRILN